MPDNNLLKKGVWFSVTSFFILMTAGCASLLPSAKETTKTHLWGTFNEAKGAFDRVIPYETKVDELRSLGYDPFTTPNFKILTHLDIIQRFMANPSIKKEDLDKGIQACIDAKTDCRSYEIQLRNISRKRYGNVLLDLFNFKRKTKESGWVFEALIVMVNGTVVHKLWGGSPMIDENTEVNNPLGPLQDPSGVLRDRALTTLQQLQP
ncbi:MAG: hypothetical protein C4581_13270 [Nitrospiraceae bacterium]|nr:MAG: hypothetical protein C4581_13270 [Nitrospiraceae bacterium]